jgi:hypothetical protein
LLKPLDNRPFFHGIAEAWHGDYIGHRLAALLLMRGFGENGLAMLTAAKIKHTAQLEHTGPGVPCAGLKDNCLTPKLIPLAKSAHAALP